MLAILHHKSSVSITTKSFLLQDIIFAGHSASQIIGQLHDKIVQMEEIGDKQKSVICEKLAVSIDLYYYQSRISYALCYKHIQVQHTT